MADRFDEIARDLVGCECLDALCVAQRQRIAAAIRAAVAEEREACAKIAEATAHEDLRTTPVAYQGGSHDGALWVANRIRARGAK